VSVSEPVAATPALLETGIARRRRLPISIVACLVIVAIALACIVAPDAIAPHDPDAQDLALSTSGSSSEHLLGTDRLGQDVLSRVVAGARTAIVGPIVIALGAMLIGTLLGTLAGYRGGMVDATVMRMVDLLYALPPLLVAIVVVGVLGGGYWLAVALLVFLSAPYDVRLIRGATLEQRPRAYVEAARALGLPRRTIMFGQIWPNVVPIIVANTFLTFAFSIVALSALSFLGLGVPAGTSDWGRMVADSRDEIFNEPVVILAPGLALVLTAASVNVIGDWLYERLSDRGRAR
jgi:peptide/nickel transport system permease protein